MRAHQNDSLLKRSQAEQVKDRILMIVKKKKKKKRSFRAYVAKITVS